MRISFYFSESRRVLGCKSIADLSLKIVFWTHKCSWDSLILQTASPRTHKPKIVNESLCFLQPNILSEFSLTFYWLFGTLALYCAPFTRCTIVQSVHVTYAINGGLCPHTPSIVFKFCIHHIKNNLEANIH